MNEAAPNEAIRYYGNTSYGFTKLGRPINDQNGRTAPLQQSKPVNYDKMIH